MEARYAFRKRPLLDECPMAPEIFEQIMPRLSTFMQPFVRIFQGQAADQHATTSVCGLLSNVERKNIASMAYRFGQSRLPLPSGIGWDAWDDAPLREELRGQVKTHLGQSDGVLVCDPSGCPKSGRESVGVARPWCGRLGKVENCQGVLSLGEASRKGHTLVDTRRSLPKEWTKDKARLDKAGVPKASRPIARVTSWPWRCWRKTVPRCRIGGWRVTTRWDDRLGVVVAWRPWVSRTCGPGLRTR